MRLDQVLCDAAERYGEGSPVGMSRIRKQQFFREHPFCIFCGGEKMATSIEHCPPRAMFDDRSAPEGFEFSACSDCNLGTSNQDLLISWMARIDYTENSMVGDQRTERLLKAVNLQFPGLIRRMLPSASEARRTNRLLGIRPPPGRTHLETGVVNITSEMVRAVEVFTRKLSKCVYFTHSRQVFPVGGCILLAWFTNVEFVKKSGFVPFSVLQNVAGVSPLMVRNKRILNDQFSYKYSSSDDGNIFALQAMFGNSFGVMIFGCVISGHLEKTLERTLGEGALQSGPFTVLQSPVLMAVP